MKLSEISAETKPLTVPFESGDLKVRYRPNSFTANAADEINAAMADPQKQTNGMFRMVAAIIAEWDLEDEDGKVVPLDDPAYLREHVPMGVFGRIFQTMNSDQNPGEVAARS